MRGPRRPSLPLVPLLRAYLDAGPPAEDHLTALPGLGPRFQAVLAAQQDLLCGRFLDTAGSGDFQTALVRFYEACVQPALHVEALRRRSGIIRHALTHLLRCRDPLAVKAARCLAAEGPYHVAGLGPAFWSALFQALDPRHHPGWTSAVEEGARRLGLLDGPAPTYGDLLDAHARIRTLAPALTAWHVDHFLTRAAAMDGRDLWAEPEPQPDLASVVRQERARLPLRQRLKERGDTLAAARQVLEAGLQAQDGTRLGAALAVADPASAARAPLDWRAHGEALTLWAGRLWEADEPYEVLADFWRADPLPGAGLWLPAAILHLRDPYRFLPWDEASRQGYARLDDSAAFAAGDAAVEQYQLFNEGSAHLRERHRIHPLEAPAVLAALGRTEDEKAKPQGLGRFGGFCADTFRFLAELGRNNRRAWMDGQRERYRFAVREPLVELCEALAARYVEPVLAGKHGWALETTARSGRALTSICKNDYGRSQPYQTALWITFYRKDRGGKRDDVQFYVRLDAAGLTCGLGLGRAARAAGRLFRRNVREHAEPLYHALQQSGALAECRFSNDDGLDRAIPPTGPGDLRAWAAGKKLFAGRAFHPTDPRLRSDDLVGEILLAFDRLLPLYACAVEPDPLLLLSPPTGDGGAFGEADFCRATFLSADWLRRARDLLALKRQLILQGVPGTGKTHVARMLARTLTGGREEALRLVQFHPAYSYEEFVEGVKVRSVEVDGRHDVTYPVEEGLLCAFAAEAAAEPSRPHVLLIDEINRGNLPRIFGELLYLLEYREQAVGLPYSRRSFRLPANLYVIGTMNAADRSVALVDQALRRRFSFLEMPPDAAVLRAWLRQHPPAAGPAFSDRVVSLFERLNARLFGDLGPHCQIGHSYFMVPELDEARLRVVWEHHVAPLLAEHYLGRPSGCTLEQLLDDRTGRPAGRQPMAATR